MLDLLSPSIRPDGDVAAKTTPAVTRTVAQKPNKSVMVVVVIVGVSFEQQSPRLLHLLRVL